MLADATQLVAMLHADASEAVQHPNQLSDVAKKQLPTLHDRGNSVLNQKLV